MKSILKVSFVVIILMSPGCKVNKKHSSTTSWSNFDYDSVQDEYIHTQSNFTLPAKIGKWRRAREPRKLSANSFAQIPYNLDGATATVFILKPLPKEYMKSALMIELNRQIKAMNVIHPELDYLYLGNYKDRNQSDIIYGPTAAYVHKEKRSKIEVATTIVSKKGFFGVRVSYDNIKSKNFHENINSLIQYLTEKRIRLEKY